MTKGFAGPQMPHWTRDGKGSRWHSLLSQFLDHPRGNINNTQLSFSLFAGHQRLVLNWATKSCKIIEVYRSYIILYKYPRKYIGSLGESLPSYSPFEMVLACAGWRRSWPRGSALFAFLDAATGAAGLRLLWCLRAEPGWKCCPFLKWGKWLRDHHLMSFLCFLKWGYP